MKSVLIAVATAAALLLPRPVPAESTPAADPNHASALVGVWVLDHEASQSITPLLELLEAPWVARKMAAVATPTLTITATGDGGVHLINQNAIRTTDREIVADGGERERKAAFGRKTVESATWNERGQLIVTQRAYIEAGRVVEVTSTWARLGEALQLTLRADSKEGPLSIRRVFRPKP